MTEDQYYPLSLDAHQPLNSTFNNVCDFNKYDLYVEKIRTLFVPSLEPRIYSCLETFVYPDDDQEAPSKPPYLKRCLDLVATWRKPVDEFSNKLGDRGFIENMLAQAVKYLIKDGLIDCFLNSIILNNRLNRVCRNLDAAGVEKDFLRYLAVWNYINERDYWIEDDRKTSISMAGSFYDSIENYSDLDVQVGSDLDTHRNNKCFEKASKRRALNVSSEDFGKTANNFPGNCNTENCSSLEFLNSLRLESNNLKVSKSSGVRRKPRLINQTYSCRPSSCPAYRKRNAHREDWEGKTLKLRVCKICPTTFDYSLAKPLRLSKLPLPCKFDDIIAEIIKADLSIPRLSSITTRRKLQAGVTKICRCINDTLGKMSKEDVRRCRFHCEILPGFVSFKLVQREPNGCKVCLFTDRVTTDKIDGQNTPRGSFVRQKSANIEQKDSLESDRPIYESTGVNLLDEDSQIISNNEVENNNNVDSRVQNSLSLPESVLDVTEEPMSNELIGEESSNNLNGNYGNNQTCDCDPSLVDGLEYLDNKEEIKLEISNVEDSKWTTDQNNSTELSRKAVLNQSSEIAVEDKMCHCNNSGENKLGTDKSEIEKIRDTDCDDSFETKKTRNLSKELTPESSLNRLSGHKVDDQTCLCSTETFDNNVDSEKNRQSNYIKPLENSVTDFEASNCQESIILKSQESQKSNGSDEQKLLTTQLNLINSCSMLNNPNSIGQEIQHGDTSCECPSDSCGVPVRLKSINLHNDVSLLIKPVQSSKPDSQDPNLVRSILNKNSRSFDTASNDQLQPNCVESQANSWESHHPKTYEDTSIQSKISFQSNLSNEPFMIPEMKEIGTNENNQKSLQIQTEESVKMNESKKQSSLAKSPIRLNTGRASSSKSQRINISIELCPESEASEDKLINRHETISPFCQNNLTRPRRMPDLPSMWKHRCHSADAEISKKQATSQSEKNTKDECLRHLRCTNACLHSPPRPLESRDYMPPFESPSRMRNPLVFGMSTKSSVYSTCKAERQSMRKRRKRKNRDSKYANESRRFCNRIQENTHINSVTNEFPRTTMKTEKMLPSAIHNNLCHAFSASSIDRMKHLIKTKLRRILLERDKATNTPKTTLSNEKYRVSVPNGKTKRLPYSRQRCHTIWESRSASDSAHTSKTFGFNDRTSLAKVSQGDEIKRLFYSKTNSKILSSESKDMEVCSDFNSAKNLACYCLENSDQSVGSSRINVNERLIGGSDAPYKNTIDHELQCMWKRHQKSVRKITNKKVEYVSNKYDNILSSKSADCSCTENSKVVGNARLSRLFNSADCNDEATLNECQDQIIRCPGRLDWSGNSTSRHIYLYQYDNFESSNDVEDKKLCDREIDSSTFKSLTICKQDQTEMRYSRKSQKAHQKRCKDASSHSCKRQFIEESSRNIRASSLASSKIRANSHIGCQKGLGKLDQDLRSKLLQYVNLCKNVKYSLLKMLRHNDTYEVTRTSVPRCDRYKFGDS